LAVTEQAARNRRGVNALRTFLHYLEEIEEALLRRDAMRVTALMRKRTATHLPRDVREELLLLSRAPRDSLRAPIRFLRFQHRMRELARGGEALPTAQTELHLEPPAAFGVIRRRPDEAERPAACDPADEEEGEPFDSRR
jgi:hypothetical protein